MIINGIFYHIKYYSENGIDNDIEIDNEANVANDLAFIGPVLRRAFKELTINKIKNKDIANKRL